MFTFVFSWWLVDRLAFPAIMLFVRCFRLCDVGSVLVYIDVCSVKYFVADHVVRDFLIFLRWTSRRTVVFGFVRHHCLNSTVLTSMQ